MSNQEVNIPTPELRFKMDDGSQFPDWKIVPLKSIAKRQMAKNTDEKIVRVLTNSAVDGILDQQDYFKKDIAVKGNLQGYYIVDKNDYVYNPRISAAAPVGPISKNKIGKGVMSPLYTVFSFNNENSDFYEQYFKSSKWHRYLQNISNTGARHDRMSMSASDFMNMPIPMPDKKEKQKITNCLTNLDALIRYESQKLKALEAHKSGLMQKLFPIEGNTVPNLSFSTLEVDVDWEEKSLKNVFSVFQGYAFSSKDSISDGVPWLKIADVGIQKMNHSTPSYLPLEHQIKHEKFKVKLGDYVMALTRPILGSELKIARVDEVFDGALLNQRVGKLVTNENYTFVYYLLQTSQMIKDIKRSIAGSEPPNLSIQKIEDVKTYIPPKGEQKQIAGCFSSIDKLITLQEQKINVLKSYKKGLIQQLYPTSDVVGV